VSERESKEIARRWNREIEAELRREAAAARRDRDGPWRAVVWVALWLVWLGLLVLLLTVLKKLH
jgi:type VI protein secretion system component VasF